MAYNNITVSSEEGLLVINLNRPKAYNALCTELTDELYQAFSELENDLGVRVVIIAGNSKVFAAGADIMEMVNADPIAAYKNCSGAHKVFNLIESSRCPVIAAINGPALGGGCELALSCDFRIAGENALIGLPEVTLGVIPGGGGTQRLTKLIGPSRAKELVFMGVPVKAAQALELGLVNKVVADEEVLNEAKAMAAKLLERPGAALSAAKKAINYGINYDLNSGKEIEKSEFTKLFAGHDQKEGMTAFVEKRKPKFTHA